MLPKMQRGRRAISRPELVLQVIATVEGADAELPQWVVSGPYRLSEVMFCFCPQSGCSSDVIFSDVYNRTGQERS